MWLLSDSEPIVLFELFYWFFNTTLFCCSCLHETSSNHHHHPYSIIFFQVGDRHLLWYNFYQSVRAASHGGYSLRSSPITIQLLLVLLDMELHSDTLTHHHKRQWESNDCWAMFDAPDLGYRMWSCVQIKINNSIRPASIVKWTRTRRCATPPATPSFCAVALEEEGEDQDEENTVRPYEGENRLRRNLFSLFLGGDERRKKLILLRSNLGRRRMPLFSFAMG